MKTYTSSYTPKSLIALCDARKISVERFEQAVDATLTGLKIQTDFTGLQKSKGEKGQEDAAGKWLARMPQGAIKDALSYMRDIHRAEKAAKRVNAAVTLTEFPALASAWFNSFAVKTETSEAKAKAKTKMEAKEAIAATVAQVEAAKAELA